MRELECTCELMAWPCDIHDTSGPPDTVRGPAEVYVGTDYEDDYPEGTPLDRFMKGDND